MTTILAWSSESSAATTLERMRLRIFLARVAYMSVTLLCLKFCAVEWQCASMMVLEFPPNASLNSHVSGLLRYGISHSSWLLLDSADSTSAGEQTTAGAECEVLGVRGGTSS